MIGELVRTSLLTRLGDDTVRVHRLVQEITRSQLTKKDAAIWTARTVDILSNTMPENPWLPEGWERMAVLIAHVEVAVSRIELHHRKSLVYKAAQLLSGVGTFLDSHGDRLAAKDVLERALAFAKASDSHKRLGEVAILDNLATVSFQLQDYVSATKASNESLTIVQSALGPEHPMTIAPLVSLANICLTIEDPRRALVLLTRALLIKQTIGGRPDDELFAVLTALGSALRQLGDHTAARERFEQARDIARQLYGDDHPRIAPILLNLAMVMRDVDEVDTADALLQQALVILGGHLGQDHPETRRALDLAEEFGSR